MCAEFSHILFIYFFFPLSDETYYVCSVVFVDVYPKFFSLYLFPFFPYAIYSAPVYQKKETNTFTSTTDERILYAFIVKSTSTQVFQMKMWFSAPILRLLEWARTKYFHKIKTIRAPAAQQICHFLGSKWRSRADNLVPPPILRQQFSYKPGVNLTMRKIC